MTNQLPGLDQADLIEPTGLPAYQRDFIDWLHGYRRTEAYIEILKARRFTFAEIATMRDRLAAHLVPKSYGERQTPGRRGK